MIIMVRGNHGSGKSTVVRSVMQSMLCTPLYGDLGPKAPEAYCCLQNISPKHVSGPPTFVLGPYQSNATCGFDHITKLGVKAATILLEKYRLKGGNILFESIMTSVRILEPSIEERKRVSVAGTKWNSTHLVAQQRMIERVTGQYIERGYRLEYVTRENAPEKILGWLMEKR
jgi:hypothetical protein